MPTRILTLPGYQNSEPTHWQSLWEQKYPIVTRVVQNNWDAPKCSDWCDVLMHEIERESSAVILVAHSLGCLLTADLVRQAKPSVLDQVKGALLVAPPDPDESAFPKSAEGFFAYLSDVMPFSSIVVASDDDPYGSWIYAQSCAQYWGSDLINLGSRGHINANSKLGEWPEAWAWIGKWQ